MFETLNKKASEHIALTRSTHGCQNVTNDQNSQDDKSYD